MFFFLVQEKPDQRGQRGELTARTQFDKSYKGAISIDECSPDGRYIVISNNGNTVRTCTIVAAVETLISLECKTVHQVN